MHTYTALYRERSAAEATQRQLEQLGVLDADDYRMADQTAAGQWDTGRGGVSAEDRHLFDEHLRQGGYLLTVNVDDEEADEVRRVLDGSGAVDVDEREQELRTAGYSGYTGATEAAGDTIQLAEERLAVGKRMVDRGTARVRTYVVETPVQEQVTLRQEHVEVERRPLTGERAIGNTDALFQERTIEVSESSEEAVVSKEAFVREEIGIRKDVEERVETISDTLRRTEVDVERTGGESTTFADANRADDLNLTEEERLRRANLSGSASTTRSV